MKIIYPFMKTKLRAFTLAEVLITLVIIGIIASMTIPTIMANSRKIEVETRLKQTYSLLNNALTRAVADNGPMYTWDEMKTTKECQSVDFFRKYIYPYLNYAKDPKNRNFKHNYGSMYYNDGKTVYGDIDEESLLAILNNGTAIMGWNSWRVKEEKEGEEAKYSNYYGIQFIIDINGSKGRNTLGKDVFGFVLYITDKNPKFVTTGTYKISVDELESDEGNILDYEKTSRSELMQDCKSKDSGGRFCGALIQNNGWKIPKDYPVRI